MGIPQCARWHRLLEGFIIRSETRTCSGALIIEVLYDKNDFEVTDLKLRSVLRYQDKHLLNTEGAKTQREVVIDIDKIRTLFPVTEKTVFLNNAVESPLNLRTHQRLDEYLRMALNEPQNKPVDREAVRESLCELFGGSPDEYALVTSTGVGVSIVAAGLDWKPGDNVVVPAEEHWNNTFPWLNLRKQGVDVRLVPVGDDQRIHPETVASLVDKNTRILASAFVRFNTGFRTDLSLMSSIAHENNALFLVDGIQGAGVFPLDVEEMGIDILASAGFKWLLGMHGTGFLYVNKNCQDSIRPVLPGMFAAEHNFHELNFHPDARRFETGTMPYSLIHAWTAGLELLKEVGIDCIQERVLSLTDQLISGLKEKKIRIVSPVATREERSALLTFTLDSETANKELVDRLKSHNIIVALKDGRVRVSPNFYNTEDEMARLLEFV